MIGLLQRLVPRPLRFRLRAFLSDLRVAPRVRAITDLPRAVLDAPRVWYGVDPRDDRARGGRVKLRHLDLAFPDAPRDFNILYMVSSAPPEGAALLAEAARARGARVVWNQDGVAYPAWYGPGFEVVNRRLAPLVHGADHVVYQSAFCRTAADRFIGARSGPCEVLHNPVDTALFTPAERAPEGDPVLVMGGTHRHWYRVRTALHALAALRAHRPRARLLVLGVLGWRASEEEAAAETRVEARTLGLGEDAVELFGPYPQSRAPELMRRGHLFLHTQYNDACPGVVVEALSCGLPVAYGRTGGTPELVGEEAGIGVDGETSWDREIPPDAAALAQAALRILDRLPEFRAAARQRAVDRFDARAWVDRHRRIFEGLMS